jgi:hypothetical protein
MNDELERIWMVADVDQSTYFHGIFLEELSKVTKARRQDSRCSGRHSNRAPPQYQCGARPLHQPALLFG